MKTCFTLDPLHLPGRRPYAKTISVGKNFHPSAAVASIMRSNLRNHRMQATASVSAASAFVIRSAFCIFLISQMLVRSGFSAQSVSTSTPSTSQIFSLHVLPEPLVPCGGAPTPADNATLVSALDAFQKRVQSDDFSSLKKYLEANPASPWRMAVLTNLGLLYYHSGYFSKCIPTFHKAWKAGKNATDPKAKALADRAAGEYTKMLARLGRYPELKQFLGETANHHFVGQATELMAAGRGGAAEMEARPEQAFRCGPLALSRVLAAQKSPLRNAPPISNAKSTMQGMSLSEVASISHELGMNYQPAKRTPGAKLVFPCVVHWKAGHYASLLKEVDGRYLSEDPTFENETWLTPAALESESSGYFLLPPGPLPAGWAAVPEEKAKQVFGKGTTSGNKQGGTSPTDQHSGGDNNNCKGMATYSFLSMVVSVSITDTPVGYAPPYGPPVNFQVTYNQKEAGQPSNLNYSNFGQKWTFAWLSYITDDPNNPPVASVAVGGGGTKIYSNYDPASQSFGVQYETQMSLKRVSVSPVTYEQNYPDGSKDVFAQPDGSTTGPRKVFLTKHVDPAGNAVTLAYDGLLRIATITDAIGQVTTLSYDLPGDPYKITKVTDPFGRHADFTYDPSGNLTQITDVIGIQSKFTYLLDSDFIDSLTTPYGTTKFTDSESGRTLRVTATDPNNDLEVLEYNEDSNLQPDGLPANQLPTGMFVRNSVLYARNSYYWDKKAWKESPNDYTKARLIHWQHTGDYSQADTGIESMKSPVEGRVWYNYPGQIQNDEGATLPGNFNDRPTRVGRVMDDGSTQLSQASYNDLGLPTSTTDPVGRVTLYTYATNKIDLLTVSQQQSNGTALLASYTWNSQHLPLTYTDAAGQTTKYTWNATGQPATVTDAKQETTTYTYYTADATGKQRNGRLATIDGALPGAADVVTFDYDAVGRVASVIGPDGYYLSFTYDALDRLARVTYPDTTYTETIYNALTPQTTRDRLGRLTHYVYNSLRQLASVTDPANRTIQYRWCKCGDLQQLIDAMGRVTTWFHDVAGRITAKAYTDGSKITYSYEALSGRLSSVTDEQAQVKTWSYNLDNSLAGVTYTHTVQSTPNVSYSYDPYYRRITQMVDGTGTTAYAYNPAMSGTLGAGQLASVDGPLTDDTLTYSYDELGRNIGYAINGVGETRSFDVIGRLQSVVNALGTFGYTYDGSTGRMSVVTYPNGMTCGYDYFPLADDFRLKDIGYTLPGGSQLSQYSYQYNVVGNISRWTQVSAPTGLNRSWLCGYDNADQLTSVTSQDPATLANQTMGQYAYTYDTAGNRLTETIDGVTTTATYDALNQLAGSTNSGTANVPQQTYEWDAENRLTAINYPSTGMRSEFQFDGYGRRVRVTEKSGNTITSDLRYVWIGFRLAEERASGDSSVERRYFDRGMQVSSGGGPLVGQVVTRDHLGSDRELVSIAGSLSTAYDFDPWGRRTMSSGSVDQSKLAFSGYQYHAASGLALAPFRSYDPNIGRWTNRDLLFSGDLNLDDASSEVSFAYPSRGSAMYDKEISNLYAYANSNPVNEIDPLGYWAITFGGTLNFTFGGRYNFSYSAGFALDGYGNFGIYKTGGLGGGTPGGFLGLNGGGSTNADTICDLQHGFTNVGGGYGAGPGAGPAISGGHYWGTTDDGRSVSGWEGGFGIGSSGGGGSLTRTYTDIIPSGPVVGPIRFKF